MQRILPNSGQESVWDYPRPPRLERCSQRLRIEFNGEIVASTTAGYRLLETSHPPTYYIPPQDVRMELLTANDRRTFCEFKGSANYWDLQVGERIAREAAWSYATPGSSYAELRNHLAFYPSRVDACFVGEERVESQEGDFYGGWITSNLVGPFKGGPGTRFW